MEDAHCDKCDVHPPGPKRSAASHAIEADSALRIGPVKRNFCHMFLMGQVAGVCAGHRSCPGLAPAPVVNAR